MRLRIVPALSLGHHLGIHHYRSEFFPFLLGMANPDQIEWHFLVNDQINGILWNRVTHALWLEAFCGTPQLMLDDRIKWHFVELSSMIGLTDCLSDLQKYSIQDHIHKLWLSILSICIDGAFLKIVINDPIILLSTSIPDLYSPS